MASASNKPGSDGREHNPTSDASVPAPANASVPIDWRTMHLWQIQPLRDLLLIATVCVLVYVGYVLRTVTVPMLLAMLLAYLFEPVVQRLTQIRFISRQGAAVIIIGLLTLLVALPVTLGIVYGVVQGAGSAQQFAGSVETLIKSVDDPKNETFSRQLPSDVWRKIRDRIVLLREEAQRHQGPKDEPGVKPVPGASDAGDAPKAPSTSQPTPAPPSGRGQDSIAARESAEHDATSAQLYKLITGGLEWVKTNAGAIGNKAVQVGQGALDVALGALVSIAWTLFSLFLTAFFFFFFCTGYSNVLKFWESLIPVQNKPRVLDLVQKMDVVIAGFVRGRLTICAIFMVYFTLSYWIIGVPAWLVMGPIVGVMCLVPYAATLGMFIVIILLALSPQVSGVMGTWYWIFGAPIVVHMLYQSLDDYVLTPRIQGKNTGMDTPTILFASLAGGILAGFYGLLLAIPVAACVRIVLREIVWPNVRAWAAGKSADPLPIGRK